MMILTTMTTTMTIIRMMMLNTTTTTTTTVQPARNLHEPSDHGGQNYPRAVEHRGRTPVDPGGHDPRVSR